MLIASVGLEFGHDTERMACIDSMMVWGPR